MQIKLKNNCPCGSTITLLECCYPIIINPKKATTATELMRSRYTAYSLQNVKHILKTMTGKSKEQSNSKNIKAFAKQSKFLKLEIIKTEQGGENDSIGIVEFKATYENAKKTCIIHEISLFKKIAGKWLYCDDLSKPK